MLAVGVLLWLPTQPWAEVQIALTRDVQPVALKLTGYEGLMLASGLAVIPAKVATAAGALGRQDGGGSFLAQLELSDRLQAQIAALAGQTQQLSPLVMPVQIALFVLPALTLFVALTVMVSRGFFGQQLLKGMLLILLTLLTVLLTSGLMIALSERLNAVIAASQAQNVAGFPGLGVTVNDALPELRLTLLNRIDIRTPLIAGGVGLVGSIIALLGACLSANRAGLAPAQFARAAQQSAAAMADATPPTPTQRLGANANAASALQASASTPVAGAATLMPETADSSLPVCPSCGQAVTTGVKFCRSCGAKLG